MLSQVPAYVVPQADEKPMGTRRPCFRGGPLPAGGSCSNRIQHHVSGVAASSPQTSVCVSCAAHKPGHATHTNRA